MSIKYQLPLIALLAINCQLSAGQEPPPAEADPFAQGAPKVAPKPKAKKPAAEAEPAETDPNVLAIKNSNPKTADDLIVAIEQLMNLGRPNVAKVYLQRLQASNFDATTLWSMQRKFGSPLFLRLAADENVQPEGRAFSDAVLSAAAQVVRDPQRLEVLIKQLSDPAPENRYTALVDLREAGEDAAAALIVVLANPDRSSEYEVVTAALVQLRDDAKGPLLAVMGVPSTELRSRALIALGRLGARDAIPFLVRPALSPAPGGDPRLHSSAELALVRMLGKKPTMVEAEGWLHRMAMGYLKGQSFGQPDHENLVRAWHWDMAQGRPVAARLLPRQASLQMAELIADELAQLVPANREYQKLKLVAMLQSAGHEPDRQQGAPQADQSLRQKASQLSAAQLVEVIHFALDQGQSTAAASALKTLGDVSDAQQIFKSGLISIVSRSLQHPDRRVRFAALQSIMHIDPRERYAGSSFVTEALGYFVSNGGKPRALVVNPRVDLSQNQVGILREMGYEADGVVTGVQAVQMANRNSDYEFAMISDGTDHPLVRDLLQQLRHDPRTAYLPVAILTREENKDRIEFLVEGDPLTISIPPQYEMAGTSFLIGQLHARAGERFLMAEERLQQASTALGYIAMLAEKPEIYGFYELITQQPAVERALATPPLTERAARVLGLFATPSAQRWLVGLASQSDRPLTQRQAAATAFDVAVERRGLLLTRAEILTQYERYNASATLDQETQRVLGAVLDTIDPRSAPENNSPAR